MLNGTMPDALLAAERAAFAARRELQTLADALQGEFDGTVAEVSDASEATEQAAKAMHDALELIRTHAEALSSNAGNATTSVDAVAAATEEMSVSISQVGEQIREASSKASDAVTEAREAMGTIERLAEASEKIGDVVKLIEGIAGQTNLLALNATIEAARAGEAGKGFAVVANEVKTLAGQTANATKDITDQVGEIQQVARSVVDVIAHITDSITQVEHYSGEVEGNVREQIQAVAEIGRNAQAAATGTRQVTDAVGGVVDELGRVGDMSSQQQESASLVKDKVMTLQQRLDVAVRETGSAGAGGLKRLPFDLVASLDGQDVLLRHLSAEGGLLVADTPPAEGTRIRLGIEPVGQIDVTVEGAGEDGVNLRLDEGGRRVVDQLLSSGIAMDQKYIHWCIDFANRAAARFTQGVENGEITMEDLFDTDYQEVGGSDPLQHSVRYLKFTDDVLPAFQEPILEKDDKIIFCAAVDVNGYLPTHNLKYNHPQKPDDPVWNAANCRNRRIFGDRTGKAAGANTRPYLLQSYLRDMGGGNFVLMKDLTAPIVVRGRNWGNLRLGYKPD